MSERIYISTTDTAKLIRQALKESFPGIKFSVRSDKYSGGSSIDVSWTDGPNTAQVKAVSDRFSGATFDGMIDLKSYVTATFDGKPTHFGADYVFEHRDHSDALTQRAIDYVWEKFAWQYGTMKPTVDDFNMGRTWGTLMCGFKNHGENFQTEMHRELSKRTQVAKVQPSKTMDRFKVSKR